MCGVISLRPNMPALGEVQPDLQGDQSASCFAGYEPLAVGSGLVHARGAWEALRDKDCHAHAITILSIALIISW